MYFELALLYKINRPFWLNILLLVLRFLRFRQVEEFLYSDQGCQVVCFQTINPTLGKFWRALLVYFTYGHLVHYTVFYYILWTFGAVRGIFFPFWYFVPREIWQPCCRLRRLGTRVNFAKLGSGLRGTCYLYNKTRWCARHTFGVIVSSASGFTWFGLASSWQTKQIRR
jgi:hypothetical protein